MIAEVLALGTDVERWRGEATAARAEITGAVDRLAARVQGDEKVGSHSLEGCSWLGKRPLGMAALLARAVKLTCTPGASCWTSQHP